MRSTGNRLSQSRHRLAWMKLLYQETRNALSTRVRDLQQLANPRRANGARPGLEHCSQRLSLRPLCSRRQRRQGLVRPGPMEPDTNKRQPCQIGLALAAWGNEPLISLRHPARLPGLPLSPGNVQRTIVGRLCQPGGLAASSRRDRVLPAPSASPGSRRTGNGASAEGLAPRGEGPVFRPSPSFLTGWSSR